MLAVDIAVGTVIAVAVLGGLAVGAARTLPVAGFAIGAVLGSRLPLLLGADLDSDFSLAAALPGALLAGALLGALAERFAWGLNRRVRRRPRLDALGGALLAGIAGVVAVWLLAPAAAELRPVRDSIAQSEVLGGLNDVLRAAGPDRRPEPAPIMELPTFVGRGPNVAAGDPAIAPRRAADTPWEAVGWRPRASSQRTRTSSQGRTRSPSSRAAQDRRTLPFRSGSTLRTTSRCCASRDFPAFACCRWCPSRGPARRVPSSAFRSAAEPSGARVSVRRPIGRSGA
jgi:hypothetical protein